MIRTYPFVSVLAALLATSPLNAQDAPTIIRAARMLDVESGRMIQDARAGRAASVCVRRRAVRRALPRDHRAPDLAAHVGDAQVAFSSPRAA